MTVTVEVYGTDWCPYCVAAERLLTARDIPYTHVTVSPEELRGRVLELSGRLTIPLIVIDGRPIGGYQELAALDRSGRLAQLVAPAAA
jgi:glutaredoxin 3